MRDNIVTGKKGEELAAVYIADLGFRVIACNWRYRRFEIDLIAARSGVLHFIEVKTRTSLTFGYPEESVSNKKIKSMLKAGSTFAYLNPGWQNVQYDILSILIMDEAQPEFLFIEDIYL